jgi:hypothetical protein
LRPDPDGESEKHKPFSQDRIMATGESSRDRDPLDRMAEEFVARHRRGEHPGLTEYTDRHPEQAGPVWDLACSPDGTRIATPGGQSSAQGLGRLIQSRWSADRLGDPGRHRQDLGRNSPGRAARGVNQETVSKARWFSI